MTITPEQFETLLTKRDGERFATKEDLERFATKDEMKARFDAAFDLFASKDDLKAFATKADILEMKSEILKSIDSFAKAVTDVKEEQTANVGAHDRIQENVGALDLRITKIENVIAEGL